MRRLLPRSLLGQMLLLMGGALLLAQAINLAFILTEQQKLSLARNEGPVIARFVQLSSALARAEPTDRGALLAQYPWRRGTLYWVSHESRTRTPAGAGDAALRSRLIDALREAQVPFRQVRAEGRDLRPEHRHLPAVPGAAPHERRALFLSVQFTDGTWFEARVAAPGVDHWLIHRMLLATLALFAVVFGAVWWIARRLARPLRGLTLAAESFEGRSDPPHVEPRGPADVRQAIEAFNAMNRRTVRLLDEKDRMLGALGHDLRTPLASLRIRAEAVEPAAEREKLIATVEEMAATVEDILTLARTGRAREPVRRVDVAALADAVVETFREMGQPAEFLASPRTVAPVQPGLLRRAVNNLIDNAIAYGGGARVAVAEGEASVEIVVEDDGPGIPDGEIEAVLEPFRRLEVSRNRESGGAGLGLAIARAVALAHGGALRLSNRPEGGLRAVLAVPKRP